MNDHHKTEMPPEQEPQSSRNQKWEHSLKRLTDFMYHKVNAINLIDDAPYIICGVLVVGYLWPRLYFVHENASPSEYLLYWMKVTVPVIFIGTCAGLAYRRLTMFLVKTLGESPPFVIIMLITVLLIATILFILIHIMPEALYESIF